MLIRKILKIIIIIFLINNVFSRKINHQDVNQIVLQAQQAYNANNVNLIISLYENNRSNNIINYFYSMTLINNKKIIAIKKYIDSSEDSFLRSDAVHELLNYYLDQDDFITYMDDYRHYASFLNERQLKLNEQCALDYANLHYDSKSKETTNIKWLIRNNIPKWCANLLSYKFLNGVINKNDFQIMLINLIINNKIDIFNNIARKFNIPPVKNYRYFDSQNIYQVVYSIVNLASSDIDASYIALHNSNLPVILKSRLYAFLAMKYAFNFEYKMASKLNKQYVNFNDILYISDEELEWYMRANLASGNYGGVIDGYEYMNDNLKNKNVWIYWASISYAKSGEEDLARKILKNITKDYSYYYLLASSKLNLDIPFNYSIESKGKTFLNKELSKQIANALLIYDLGIRYNNKQLLSLGYAMWNYVVKVANQKQLLELSIVAFKKGYFELSITAGNLLDIRNITLSFPKPFMQYYIKYAKKYNINVNFLLAISRQESKFNYLALATDGGVGLMQLMPNTANDIMSRLNITRPCYKNSVQCNIQLGSWYLANLNDKFNNMIYASAAYNAGPSRAVLWENNLNHFNTILQIELIPFQITRNYVQRIISNYAIYDFTNSNDKTFNFNKYINKKINTHISYNGTIQNQVAYNEIESIIVNENL